MGVSISKYFLASFSVRGRNHCQGITQSGGPYHGRKKSLLNDCPFHEDGEPTLDECCRHFHCEILNVCVMEYISNTEAFFCAQNFSCRVLNFCEMNYVSDHDLCEF